MALALVGSTAIAGPKKKPASPKPTPANTGGGSDAGDIEMDDSGNGSASGGGTSTGASGSDTGGDIDMDDNSSKPSDLSADLAASDQGSAGPVQTGAVKKIPLSWKDIVVVIRKPFLKRHRVELNPMFGTTMNDNMIRHYAFGGELAYWVTDVLAVGVEGFYFTHTFLDPFDLVARQARRLPTVNQYNWQFALDFHYVPIYGKFALLDRKLLQWEIGLTAGIGLGQSEVIPRDKTFPGFNNTLVQGNFGADMRFFLTKWLTVNLGLRDYLFNDHYEPVDRSPTNFPTAAEAKDNAQSGFINNVMFQIGLSFWLPTSFEYTTFR